MIQGSIFRNAFLGQKSNLRDSQPSVNSKLHQSPTGPVTSLQRDECKHKFHCGAHAKEIRCVFCIQVCASLLCREDRTRGHVVYTRSTPRRTGVSITSHNNPLHTRIHAHPPLADGGNLLHSSTNSITHSDRAAH